ncbi:MAG: hypothetical protein OSJ67_07685 [Clostridia bacterium]|jgi:hypothetical protein|nr:hypothetical protein [Clostridia bacterium]
MQQYEFIAISLVSTLVFLLILLLFKTKRSVTIALMINSLSGALLYSILTFSNVYQQSRISSLIIGVLGVIYAVALLFV